MISNQKWKILEALREGPCTHRKLKKITRSSNVSRLVCALKKNVDDDIRSKRVNIEGARHTVYYIAGIKTKR